MRTLKRWILSLCVIAAHPAVGRPVVVFDLDHTLFDTNTRIVAMLRDLAVEFDVPELLAVTTEQVEALRLRGVDTLGFKDPAAVKLLFGRRGDHSLKHSPFGQRFYNDPGYLVHDAVIPGAPEFVERIALELGADVYYITGRTDEIFREATVAQLRWYDFPGYSARRGSTVHQKLILKPAVVEGSTDAWKVARFARLTADHQIVAVFDDARRNVNAFAKVLPAEVPIVRLTRNVADRTQLDDRIEQITNYVYNTTVNSSGERTSAVNGVQLRAIVARARCAIRLSN